MRRGLVWAVGLTLLFLLMGCAMRGKGPAPTPSPVPTSTPTPTERAASPTPTPTATPTATPTSTPTPTPTATPTPTSTPTPTPQPLARPSDTGENTAHPNELRIRLTEEDALALLAHQSQVPVEYDNVRLHFREDGRIEIWADHVSYGWVHLNHLHLIGRVEVMSCRAQLVVEEMEPGGLWARVVPTLVNRALEEYTRGYCVEQVEIHEGEMTILLRP